jgi:hypothetical protein
MVAVLKVQRLLLLMVGRVVRTTFLVVVEVLVLMPLLTQQEVQELLP